MTRISIDVTPHEHQRLKALAALQGKTIKEFVLARTLGAETDDEAAAVAELEALIDKRLRRFEEEGPSTGTVADIFQQARGEAKPDA